MNDPPTSYHTLKSTPGRYWSKGKAIKLLEENKREYLHDLKVSKGAFDRPQKALTIKTLINWTKIKLRSSVV